MGSLDYWMTLGWLAAQMMERGAWIVICWTDPAMSWCDAFWYTF